MTDGTNYVITTMTERQTELLESRERSVQRLSFLKNEQARTEATIEEIDRSLNDIVEVLGALPVSVAA